MSRRPRSRPSLREIEDLNRRLGERARVEGRIFRGTPRIDPRGLQAPAQAVEKLRELAAEARERCPDAGSVGALRAPIRADSSLRIVGEEPVDTDLGEVTRELSAAW